MEKIQLTWVIAFAIVFVFCFFIAVWFQAGFRNSDNFKLCNSFCHCGEGNYTVITYTAEMKLKGWTECTCLLSELENPAVFRQGLTYIVSENYTCGE